MSDAAATRSASADRRFDRALIVALVITVAVIIVTASLTMAQVSKAASERRRTTSDRVIDAIAGRQKTHLALQSRTIPADR